MVFSYPNSSRCLFVCITWDTLDFPHAHHTFERQQRNGNLNGVRTTTHFIVGLQVSHQGCHRATVCLDLGRGLMQHYSMTTCQWVNQNPERNARGLHGTVAYAKALAIGV